MKKKLILILLLISRTFILAQEYNSDWQYLANYVQRMYESSPFEGARIVENVDCCYLVCVVAESLSGNKSITSRKAQVRGLSMANEFLNGAHISQNTLLHSIEDSNGYTFEEIEDFIESRSMGYVQTMQLISNFENKEQSIFVYCKQLPLPEKGKGNRKGSKKKKR